MNCSKCQTDGVQNEALGKLFWYCRTCKDEIVEPLPEVPSNEDEFPYGNWMSQLAQQTVNAVTNLITLPTGFDRHLSDLTAQSHGLQGASHVISRTIDVMTYNVTISRGHSAFTLDVANKALWKFMPEAFIPYRRNPLPALFGIDRALDPTGYAGNYYPGSLDISFALQHISSLIYRAGGNPTRIFMCNADYTKLLLEMGCKHYTPSFTLRIYADDVIIESDDFCPLDHAWALDMSTWVLDPVFGAYCIRPEYNGVVKLR